MTFGEFLYLTRSDLFRYAGDAGCKAFLNCMRWMPGYKYSFYMRLCKYMKSGRITRYTLYYGVLMMYKHYMYKYGIDIPFDTDIGSGLYIGHFGCIVVNEQCRIGKNFNISQGVTLGRANRGDHAGCPVIGDNVYIGPGAKIVGRVQVGNNVAIGANCVCTKDAPDNSVMVGIPGRIISYRGSEGYVNRTAYASKI